MPAAPVNPPVVINAVNAQLPSIQDSFANQESWPIPDEELGQMNQELENRVINVRAASVAP